MGFRSSFIVEAYPIFSKQLEVVNVAILFHPVEEHIPCEQILGLLHISAIARHTWVTVLEALNNSLGD